MGAGYLQGARPGSEWVRPKELVPVASSDTWLPVTGGHSEPGFQWACCAPTATPPCLAASERQRKQLLGPRDEVPGQRSSILWGGISREPSCVLIINFCLSSGHRCGISCLSLLTLLWKVSGSSPAVSLGYLSWHRSWIHKPGVFLLWDASQGGWPGRGLCGAVGEVTRLPP